MRVPTLVILSLTLVITACDSAESAEATPSVELDATAIEPRVRVRAVEAERGRLDEIGDATGIVEPFALARVASETAGRVQARRVDRGSVVEEGTLLVELDASRARIQVRQADATLAARQSDREQAERERTRSDQLRQRESVSAAAYDRSAHLANSAAAAEDIALLGKRAAADALRDAKIAAPFAGTIADFHVEIGEFVGPGTPVVTLVDLTRVRLQVGVTAAEAGDLRVGDRLDVQFSELGGRTLSGELHSVSPLADPRSGTYTAELWLDNPEGLLRQGMIGRVSLRPTNARTDVPAFEPLLVPRAAVLRREGVFSVWVVADGHAEAVEVALGRADDRRVEVLDGLAPGDWVVIDGGFALREGAAVELEQAHVQVAQADTKEVR
jgi:membrane fusion protein (multidrug efflux system)